MIIAAISIGIILILLVILTFYISDRNGSVFDGGVLLGVGIALLAFIEIGIIGYITSDPRPTAMDVYQGKTTLEYKVVDGVKIDSVVIFKNSDCGISNRNCCTGKPDPTGN